MIYSALANTWFDPTLRQSYEAAGNWPIDAKEFPNAVYNSVVRDRPPNKLMQPDANGDPILVDIPLPSSEELIAQYTSIIQSRLDTFAQTRGYDNVNSAAKYKEISDAEISTLPVELRDDVTKFRAEGRYLSLKSAETWARAYVILATFQSTGEIPSIEGIESQLPVLEWPN